MRHRPHLGEEERERCNQRDAKFLGVIQFSQAATVESTDRS
ncbi:MAG TPA: hypothetical protein VN815_03840 [Steroidobacteraceae bacterium]|nr:hypothetical protein [Steroidobacteraceae bacterium]